MKVLLAWNGPANGDERSVMARRHVPLLQCLAAQGVRATVALCGDQAGLRADLEDAGICVEVLPTPLPPSPAALGRLPMAVARLERLIRRVGPTVLEGDEPIPAIAMGLAARGRDHGVVVYRRHHAGGRKRLTIASRLAAGLADWTIVSSQTMRTQASHDDRTPLARIEVAASGTMEPRPVSPDDVVAARRSLGINDTAGVIGVVARLRWEKGLDVLLHALRRLDGCGETHLVIAGTGPEEGALRQLAAASPVPVHFLGHRNDVDCWLAVADVVAIPSRRETFGRVTLETMAAGRPLVASRVGGLAEAVVDNVTGRLVPPDDPDALAEALGALLADRDIARRMGAAARSRYEATYTIGHMATSWRHAWERVTAGAGEGPVES